MIVHTMRVRWNCRACSVSRPHILHSSKPLTNLTRYSKDGSIEKSMIFGDAVKCEIWDVFISRKSWFVRWVAVEVCRCTYLDTQMLNPLHLVCVYDSHSFALFGPCVKYVFTSKDHHIFTLKQMFHLSDPPVILLMVQKSCTTWDV